MSTRSQIFRTKWATQLGGKAKTDRKVLPTLVVGQLDTDRDWGTRKMSVVSDRNRDWGVKRPVADRLVAKLKIMKGRPAAVTAGVWSPPIIDAAFTQSRYAFARDNPYATPNVRESTAAKEGWVVGGWPLSLNACNAGPGIWTY